MGLVTTNPNTLEGRTAAEMSRILNAARDSQQIYLRRQFDSALLDSTAFAVIRASELLGHDDLAEEMKADLSTILNP